MFVGDWERELFHDYEHIFPDFSFLCEGVFIGQEKEGGVMADAEGGVGDLMPGWTEAIEAFFTFEQAMGSCSSEGDDDFGAHDFDLGEDEGARELDFLGAGRAVVARLAGESGAEFAEVCEVDLFTGKSHRLENGIELFACGSGEGFAFLFFVIAGGVADEHEVGGGWSGGEDEVWAEGAEVAEGGPVLGEVAEVGELFLGGVALDGGFGNVEGGLLLRASGGAGNHGLPLRCGRFLLGCFFSEGDFSFVDFAQNIARLRGDRDVGLALGKELAQVGKEHR